MNRSKQNGNTRLLPFHTIEAAAGGDVGAINTVLKHYEGYIIALSTRRLYDEDGNARYFVDSNRRLIADNAIWDWYNRVKTTAAKGA